MALGTDSGVGGDYPGGKCFKQWLKSLPVVSKTSLQTKKKGWRVRPDESGSQQRKTARTHTEIGSSLRSWGIIKIKENMKQLVRAADRNRAVGFIAALGGPERQMGLRHEKSRLIAAAILSHNTGTAREKSLGKRGWWGSRTLE